ncbi:MAG: extracellular solute-binding protein [Deltaproteobacteria bacterium]
MKKTKLLPLLILAALGLTACQPKTAENQVQKQVQNNKPQQVIVYTSVDQVFSEPVLKDFEAKTGIKVLSVYDVEATKTVGLVNRLIAEKNKPQADVFWNGEFVNTILLKDKDVLAQYKSPSASDIPANFIDADSKWTGFGGRARVLLVNKKLVKPADYPKSIYDLVSDKYKGERIGIAKPVFGTTATHAAALYAVLGPEKAKEFFAKVRDRKLQIVDGNSVVKDMVAAGKLDMGLTDTDDAYSAVKDGGPVDIVVLDQDEKGMGTLVIPNTVGLVANGPNAEAGKKLVDYLLSKENEARLLTDGWIDLTVRKVDAKPKTDKYNNIKSIKAAFLDIYKQLEPAKKDMQEMFVK